MTRAIAETRMKVSSKYHETRVPNNSNVPIYRVYFIGFMVETTNGNLARQVYNRCKRILREFRMPVSIWELKIYQDDKEIIQHRSPLK